MADTLQDLRKSLDLIDNALILLLAERFHITEKVGVYKKEHKLNPVDPEREAAQFARIEKLAGEAGLNPAFAHKFLRLVIDEVVTNHKALQGKEA